MAGRDLEQRVDGGLINAENIEQVENQQQHVDIIQAIAQHPGGNERGLRDVTNEFPVVQPGGLNYISTGLLAYLKKKAEGKAILKQYETAKKNNVPLKRTIRNRLSRLVIGREKEHLVKDVNENNQLSSFVITRARFELLASEIAEIFKGESAITYFKAYECTGNGPSKISIFASGKLWNHYNYTKKKLREDLLLRGNPINRPRHEMNPDELAVQIDENEYIQWLKCHLEPRDELIEKWIFSYPTRRRMLIEFHLSIFKYMEAFPCLKNQEAKELFDLDFEQLYPDRYFVNDNQWKKLKPILISSLNQPECKITIPQDSILLGLLSSGDLSSEKENFIIFYLLCYLIKPKRSGKRKRDENDAQNANPPAKLSIQERRESFILRVESADNIEIRVQELKERFQQDNETFQPCIIAVGSANRIEGYHVIVNEQLFDVDTVLEAVELALKIFFTLDCHYPKYTKTIWTFLHKILLDIDLPDDEVTVDGSALIGHIRHINIRQTEADAE